MNSLKLATITLTSMFLLVACTQDKTPFEDDLIGTWTVTKVKGQQFLNGVPGIDATDDSPSGFVRFDRDGRGEQNYTFNLLGFEFPNTGNFIWLSNAIEIRIKQSGNPDLIWKREVNQPNLQVATYTIVVSPEITIDYTLTLEK